MPVNNRLSKQTSPYLLLHADNPVHWQPWDEQALQLAQRENKPILLSIGYSACHWCHVMAHESFADSSTATIMNEHFVNIKVDREERPDLDTIYQTALANMGQQRGWPLTMFLSPSGDPYAGGTYFPPEARHGFPAFKEVMLLAADTYVADPEKAKKNTARLITELGHHQSPKGELSVELMNHAANQLLDNVDVVYGGLGMGAKFPQPMFQELMWRAYCRTGHTSYRTAVETTADHMCSGGIYDHLGGGFARYSVDDRWLIPHFEKMLYDNALIISLLTLIWQGIKKPLYENCIKESIDWMIREMQTPNGGFATSLAADSDGYADTEPGEGAFYIWDEAEIDNLLGDDADEFKAYFGVSGEGNWEGVNILNRIESPYDQDRITERRLSALKEKLRIARERRPRPELDDKVLVDWNGLAIAALAEASITFHCPQWLDAACKAYESIMNTAGDGNLLYHSYRLKQHSDIAILDDYANMSHAALRLFEATNDPAYLNQAQAWVAVANKHYWDKKEGGYTFTADNAASVIVRTKTASETSTPSGNGVMVGVLARLYALTLEEDYRQRAETILSTFSMQVSSNYLGMATLINNSELLRDLTQIIVLGDSESQETQCLLKAISETSLPNRLLQVLSPDTKLPASHPAAGKTQIDNKGTVYICRGTTCQLPVTDADELKNVLGKNLSDGCHNTA